MSAMTRDEAYVAYHNLLAGMVHIHGVSPVSGMAGRWAAAGLYGLLRQNGEKSDVACMIVAEVAECSTENVLRYCREFLKWQGPVPPPPVKPRYTKPSKRRL